MRTFQIFVRESMFPPAPSEGGEVGAPPMAIIGKLDAYTEFEGVIRHNDRGSWRLSISADNPQSRLLQPGRGIVVLQEGQDPLLSGPITAIERIWDEEHAGAGTVSVTGVDDNYLIGERLAWTHPTADIHLANAYQHWQADPSWQHVAELLRQLFWANFHGHPSRRLDRVFIPPAESLTGFLPDDTPRAARLRFDRIDELTAMLSAAYGFRLRFVWHPDPSSEGSNGDPRADGPGIILRIEPVLNLVNEVAFAPDRGNLRGYKYSVKAPEATRLVLATQNRKWRELEVTPTYDPSGGVWGYTEQWVDKEGPERWFGYFKNTEYDPQWWGDPEKTPEDKQHTLPWAQAGFSAPEVEWGFTTERFRDRRDIPWQFLQDPTKEEGWFQDPPPWTSQYRAIMDEVRAFAAECGPKASIVIDPFETPELRYGVHYNLGDLIRVYVDGQPIDEMVREVRITANVSDGPRVQPVIGSAGSSETPYLYAAIRSLWDRVRSVESREDLRAGLEEVPPTEFVLKKATDI